MNKRQNIETKYRYLRKVQQQQFVSGVTAELDVIGLFHQKSQVCVHLLFVREQKILGSKSFFPSIPSQSSDEEILSAFISQYYLGDEVNSGRIPKEIVTSKAFDHQLELKALLSQQAEL